MSLVSEQSEKQVMDGLAGIEAEQIPVHEKVVRKAAFLQLISDAYPDTIDLYWLSLQLLQGVAVNNSDAKAVCGIKLRYINHFGELDK